MKNIDYLESFFRKHKLSGRIKVKYSSPVDADEFMTDIILENGDVININDVIFDIESEFPEDIVDKWLVSKREKDISLPDWIQTDIHYVPNNIDKSSVEEYQKEMSVIFEDVKDTINKLFEFEPDDEGSELENE